MVNTILALDIGGTNARFALFHKESKEIVKTKTIHTKHIANIIKSINDFLKEAHEENNLWTCDTCSIAIAGAVNNNKCPRSVNVPFEINDETITRETAIEKVIVMNDLTAVSYALTTLDLASKEVIPLLNKEHHINHSTIACVMPGTGLGISYAPYINNKYHPQPSEGGHASVSPRTQEDVKILEHMQKNKIQKECPLDAELVCSGKGIGYLFDYFYEHETEENLKHSFAIKTIMDMDKNPTVLEDRSKNIAQLAAHNSLCKKPIMKFFEFLAQVSSNTALNYLPYSGLFICGTIVTKNKELLLESNFSTVFLQNMYQSDLLTKIPVYLVLEDDLPLKGAITAAL